MVETNDRDPPCHPPTFSQSGLYCKIAAQAQDKRRLQASLLTNSSLTEESNPELQKQPLLGHETY